MNSENTFYSKKDKWLGVLIWAPMLVVLIWTFYLEEWITVIIVGITIIPIWYIWFETKYIIDDDILLIKIGGISFYKIKIKEIIQIKRSRSWMSAPANSLDRIEFTYAKRSKIMISPEDEWMLLERLKAINPNIEIQFDNVQFKNT